MAALKGSVDGKLGAIMASLQQLDLTVNSVGAEGARALGEA